MTYGFRLTLVWLVGCLLAFVVAFNYLPAALVDGRYIPVGIDSFYHARRILDSVASAGGFYEFDPLIHYPEGSWIPWPWAYDYGMATIVRGVLAVFGPRDPMSVLAYLPVYAIPVTVALVLGIAGALRLSLPMRALVVISIAMSPLTQALHGVGAVDHHFAEHICVLLSILCALLWLRAPQPSWWAGALGLTLGAAVAIHNGLFILQLPVLGSLLLLWIRGQPVHRASAGRLAAGLIVGTALAVLPARALHEGMFDFYLLSWFHVYVAACTAAVAVLLSRYPFSQRNVLWLGAVMLALAAPLLAQAIMGSVYLAGQTDVLRNIAEVESPVHMAFGNDPGQVSRLYGLLAWTAPICLAIAAVQVFRDRRAEFTYFWVASVFLLALLLMQYRFFDYGSIAMYAIPFWALDRLRSRWPRHANTVLAGGCILAIVALLPPLKVMLFARFAPSLDPEYANSRQIYPVLGSACEAAPGVVLAGADYGNYVRYHTRCAVIANNFLVTQQDTDKVHRVKHLFSLSPQDLLDEAPEVRYVIAKIVAPYVRQPDGTLTATQPALLAQINQRLDAQLILSDPAQLPRRFRLLTEVRHADDLPFPIARVFEVLPSDAPQVTPQAGAP